MVDFKAILQHISGIQSSWSSLTWNSSIRLWKTNMGATLMKVKLCTTRFKNEYIFKLTLSSHNNWDSESDWEAFYLNQFSRKQNENENGYWKIPQPSELTKELIAYIHAL